MQAVIYNLHYQNRLCIIHGSVIFSYTDCSRGENSQSTINTSFIHPFGCTHARRTRTHGNSDTRPWVKELRMVFLNACIVLFLHWWLLRQLTNTLVWLTRPLCCYGCSPVSLLACCIMSSSNVHSQTM